jgi:hypothetical protein
MTGSHRCVLPRVRTVLASITSNRVASVRSAPARSRIPSPEHAITGSPGRGRASPRNELQDAGFAGSELPGAAPMPCRGLLPQIFDIRNSP